VNIGGVVVEIPLTPGAKMGWEIGGNHLHLVKLIQDRVDPRLIGYPVREFQ
jgi:hypothetical protein